MRRVVPLFLIHYVHKNAGRSSLVLALDRLAHRSACSTPHERDAGLVLHLHRHTKTRLRGLVFYLWTYRVKH